MRKGGGDVYNSTNQMKTAADRPSSAHTATKTMKSFFFSPLLLLPFFLYYKEKKGVAITYIVSCIVDTHIVYVLYYYKNYLYAKTLYRLYSVYVCVTTMSRETGEKCWSVAESAGE